MHVGVAGYMGAGKSTFSATFAQEGFIVIDADAEAKSVLSLDAKVRSSIANAFGASCLRGKTIDSRALGVAAFSSVDSLRLLNRIVAPVLARHFEQRLASLKTDDAVLDAAMMPLWKLPVPLDQLFWISAPREQRMARLAARPGSSPETIDRRMRLQETVMTPPSGNEWITIVNDQQPSTMAASARTWILKTSRGLSV